MPLPSGFRLEPDVTLHLRAGGTVLRGGTPRRLLRLTPTGRRAALQLLAGAPVAGEYHGLLGRRLTSAGMAHPVPAAGSSLTVTAVVPVRDRPAALADCLAALDLPTVVVDDGSRDAAAVRAICLEHRATLLRHDRARGPGAARNLAARCVTTDVVVFVDSDAVVPPGWLDRLLPHLADPQVVAVAPRVSPRPVAGGAVQRLLRDRSPLDLGGRPALVRPGTAVPYVPTACLLVRRGALPLFEESLRFGEDVDLVWRLLAGGGVVRYDPSVVVTHAEPTTWSAALLRRYRYGTSAGPLGRRHGGQLAHLRLGALPLSAAAGLVVAPPVVSVPLAGGLATLTARRLRRAGLPADAAALLAAQGCADAVLRLGSYLRLLVPLLPLTALLSGRQRWRLLAVTAAPLAAEYLARRPLLDPLTWVTMALADDVAYACGVWRGCLQARTAGPLLPRVSLRRRPRPDRPPGRGGSRAGRAPDLP